LLTKLHTLLILFEGYSFPALPHTSSKNGVRSEDPLWLMNTFMDTLLLSLCISLIRYVSDWIFRGVLAPRTEFHIERAKSSFPYRDRRFWTKQFVHSASVPMFLEDSVELIFETGKAINLLSQIQDEVRK
jgi:hypothetical protein